MRTTEVNRLEVWKPLIIECDKLAIDDDGAGVKAVEGECNRGQPAREVEAFSRVDGGCIFVLVQLHPPAVEFYFVQPLLTARWCDAKHRLGGDDERSDVRHGRSIARHSCGRNALMVLSVNLRRDLGEAYGIT